MEALLIHNQYGIDIGDDKIVISTPDGKNSKVITNKDGRSTPSYVSFNGGHREFGSIAKINQVQFIEDTVSDLKSLIGLRYRSSERSELENRVQYELLEGKNGNTAVHISSINKDITPEELITFVINNLADKGKFNDCDVVLSVPADWTPSRRKRLIDSLQAIDVNVKQLVSTTAAAAINYAHTNNSIVTESPVEGLFIDSGKSSTTVSLISVSKKNVIVQKTLTNNVFCGRRLDDILIQEVLHRLKQKFHFEMNESKRTKLRLLKSVESLKKTLSSNKICEFEFTSPSLDGEYKLQFTRDDFEKLIEDSLFSLSTTIENVVSSSRNGVKFVEVFSRSSRIPSFKSTVERVCHVSASTTMDSDECVSLGCGFLSDKFHNINLIERYPLSFSVEPSSVTLFPENSQIPATAELKFDPSEFSYTVLCGRDQVASITLNDGVNQKDQFDIKIGLSSNGTLDVGYDERVTLEIEGSIEQEDLMDLKKKLTQMEISDEVNVKLEHSRNNLEAVINSCDRIIREFPEYIAAQNISTEYLAQKVKEARIFYEQNEFDESVTSDNYEKIASELGEISSKIISVKKSHEDYEDSIKQMLTKANNLLQQSKSEMSKKECQKVIAELTALINTDKSQPISFDEHKWNRRMRSLDNVVKMSNAGVF